MARKAGFVSPSTLRGAMRRHNLTGVQVAARVGVNPSTVRNWLAGRTAPSSTKLAALADVLDLSIKDLTGGVEGPDTLADLRIKAGLSQEKLAEEIGFSQSSYSAIEQGASGLTDRARECLATFYGISEDEVREAWCRANDTLKGSTQ